MREVISIDYENGIVFGWKSAQSAQKSAIMSSLQRITNQNWNFMQKQLHN